MPDCLPYDENQLIQQVVAGNETAFARLFYSYHHKLGAYIHRLTNSTELSQDIVQEVFIKIWTQRQKLAGVDNFDAYFFGIARNHAFTALKRIATERLRSTSFVQLVYRNSNSAADNFSDAYLTLVEEAIDKLPPQQKRIYQLSKVQRLKYAEIAIQLGLSHETVKKHMHLALQSIRHYVLLHKDIALPVAIIFHLL